MKRIALVTGANRGLGFETCRQLARRGFHVILTSRDQGQGKAAAEVLRGEGGEIAYHPLDVARPDQVKEVRDFVVGEYGRLEVLVNNAGVNLDEEESVFEVAEQVFAQTLAVNFYGPLRVTRAFIPLMKRNNYGRVVNVSSVGGSLATMATMAGRMAAYRASKAALNALTRLMASALREYNIKINACVPDRSGRKWGGRGQHGMLRREWTRSSGWQRCRRADRQAGSSKTASVIPGNVLGHGTRPNPP